MPHTPDGPIVGIDLGTTNSVVAGVIDGKVHVLAEDGEQIMPSVVGLDTQNELVTGTVARNQLVAFPERTIASVKRKMGTMDALPLGEQTFTPPEVSAMILRRLCDRATRALGQPVARAVITVPAFFDENQRQATREAGELAGLRVERIINEPTAAALVYHAGTRDRKHVVVYDLGGGTFDVSAVRMEDGVVEVLSSKGDTQLGGDDFDGLLMKLVADRFETEHQIDLRDNTSTRYRLLQACEQAKQQLSTDETVCVTEEFIAEKDGQPLNLRVSVTRAEYEELIAPLVERTVESVDQALTDAGLTINQIDDLVLVGGSTRTPLVRRRLREEFLREPSRAVDPDLAVALGAVTQAAMLNGETVGPVLVDVTGYTLGIEVMDGFSMTGPSLVFAPIIHRNSPLPAVHEEAYQTVHEDQESAMIRVFQGEYPDVERNRFIGEFELDLKTDGEDRSKVVVRFDITLDGTLSVTATQPASGIRKVLNIDNALSQFQSDERDHAHARLGAMFEASQELLGESEVPGAKQWSDHDRDDDPLTPHETATENHEAGTLRPVAIALLEKARKVGSQVEQEDAEDIRSLSQQLTDALSDGNDTEIEGLCEELDDVLFYVE